MFRVLGLFSLLTFITLSFAPALIAAQDDDGYVPPQLLRVFYTDKKMLKTLDEAGIDLRCAGSGPGYVDIIVESGPITKAGHPAHKLLKGFPRVDVRVENLDKMAEQYRDKDDLGLYHTFDEAITELRSYADNYPELAEIHELGTSHK